ncbi:MAG: ketoacyl-ACP synthase III [Lentisphaerae bacterium]|nr:ketoacyl-ACP synthase III [Lentisphaerota bacterium]
MKKQIQAVKVLGTGSYLPQKVVTNDELSQTLDTSDEWIYSHTGIRSRHFAAPSESSSVVGAKAARLALESAGVKPGDIDLVLCATSTPDYGNFPSTASLIQAALGCQKAAAFDLAAACSGFVYALEVARSFIACRDEAKVLVIGAEVLTRSVDWTERNVSILFGDGAGAVVLGTCTEEDAPASRSILGSDGTGYEFIYREGGLKREPPTSKVWPVPYMQMQGRAVFNFAVRKLDEVISKLCADEGIAPASLRRIYAHQANARILEAVARRMKIPYEMFYTNLETTGNTSSASVAIILDEAVRKGELKDGDQIALAGFGAGLTWAGILMRWPYL